MRKQLLSLGRRCGRLTLVVLASVATVLLTGSTVRAQGQGEYLTQASERLTKLIAKANKEGYNLGKDKFRIGGAWLSMDKKKWVSLFTLTLESTKTYRVLAGGDNDAKDVDIRILDAAGEEVAKDADPAPLAKVNYTPNKTGKFTIQLRLFASEANRPSLCLAIVMAKPK
jgi:hypothetical protein